MENTIILNVASVREFAKRIQFIQTNTLIPVLSNLKLENTGDEQGWIMVKNNLNAVCIGSVQATGNPATILLDELIFLHIINNSKLEGVTIKVNESKITVNDGVQDVELPLEDPAGFPVNPKIDAEQLPLQLTAAHLRAINIAKNFVTPGEISGNFQFVHLHPEFGIYGFHNNFFYINTAFSSLPEIQLRLDECGVICATDGVGFLNLVNHHIFFSSGYTYIFTKSEAKPLNMTGIVDKLKLPGKPFTISRDGLAEFCNTANVVSQMPLADCALSPLPGGYIKLELVDKNYSRAAQRILFSNGEPDQWNFNSRLLAPVLKAVPYENIEAKTNSNFFIIGGKQGSGNGIAEEINEWFCFIGMQNQISK